MNSVTIIPEQLFLQQQATIMESRISKEQPETSQRNTILGTPRRTNTATTTTASIGGGIERIVGVTSVNLGGIEVDVEDVADRLRRLKVLTTLFPRHVKGINCRSEKSRRRVLLQRLVLKRIRRRILILLPQ